METRTFHGEIKPHELAQHLEASFERNGLEVQHFGDEKGLTVQIASAKHRRSGGATSLTVVLSEIEDGVLVKMGEQSWAGVAASLGQTALSVAKNPWSLLERLDDLASDWDVISLKKQAWKAIEDLAASRAASHQISDRLRKVVCGYCDFANPADIGECEACGAPLGDEQPQACGKCGFVNDARAIKCSQCNHGLGAAAHSGASPQESKPSGGGGMLGGAIAAVTAATMGGQSNESSAASAPPAPVTASDKPQVSCRTCGTPHDKGTLFCSSCSRPLPRR